MNNERLIRIGYYGIIFVVIIIAIFSLVTGPSEPDSEVRADMLLQMARVLALVVVIAAAASFIVNIVRNFNESKGLVIGLVVLLIIFGIGYALATPDLLDAVTELEPTDADRAVSKLTGAGLKSTLIVGGLTILASIYFGIKNVLN